ncbi:MAG: hypothetical protein J6V10_10020 [Clostridia bacterium]|nr:hypothetical protein [Clostridia bacterium]
MANMRELKKQAEALLENGVNTKEAYKSALPLLFAVRDAAANASAFGKVLKSLADELSEKAAAYAIDHPTAFTTPLSDYKDGMQRGEFESDDDVTYALTISKGDVKRVTGGNLTQAFLAGLPKGWTKQKLDANKDAIKKESAEELAKHDLYCELKRTWSMIEHAA